jgi:hypothetical protein
MVSGATKDHASTNFRWRTLKSSYGARPTCSLATRSDGDHVAYFNDAATSGGGYQMTTLGNTPGLRVIEDAASQGTYVRGARTADGALHAAWFDATKTALRYARKLKGKRWQFQQIDNAANVGKYLSMVADKNGKLHLAYFDDSNNDLVYVVGSWGPWSAPKKVDTGGNVGQHTSIALDANDRPWIAYYDASKKDLKVANKTASGGTVWTKAKVAGTSMTIGTETAIAVGKNGKIHVSTYKSTGSELAYVQCTPGSNGAVTWSALQVVDKSGAAGRKSSLLVDASDHPHIVHIETGTDTLRHTWSTNKGLAGSWKTENIINKVSNVATGLAMDGAGKLYASYRNKFNDPQVLP